MPRKMLASLLSASLLLGVTATAQPIPAAAQKAFDAARALAAQEKSWRHPGLVNCYPHDGLPSQAVNRDPLPTKVFDNLYYVGNGQFGPWVIDTSEGLILIDSMNNSFDVDKYIIPGLVALGLDPERLKVLIISHGHGDHYGGGRYLQDKFHMKVYESADDYAWTDMTVGNQRVSRGTGSPPTRDQVVKDGDTISLGDEHIKVFISPGHTPGSLSMLIPVKDHGAPKLLGYFGGITSGGLSAGLHQAFDHSYTRLIRLMSDAKIDGYIAPHPNYDDAVYKIGYMALNPKDPNPFLVGLDQTVLFLKIVQQCNLYNGALEAAGIHQGFEPRQPPDSLIHEPQ